MFELTALILVPFAATLIVTPLVRRLAFRFHLIDEPDGKRKLHAVTIPLGGGLAIFVAALASLVGMCLFRDHIEVMQGYDPSGDWGLFFAVAVLCLVGLADDRFGLRGRQKLVGQILACGILVASDLTIRSVQLFTWHIELGLLAVPFTLFWLLGAINSLNLIDGLDGLATTVGCILSLAVAGLAFLAGHQGDAILALVLAGCLMGFLCFNYPPASMFLGDTGSMLIGLVLGTLAIRCSLKGAATVALAAPTAIWAIPIFDTGMAILRRRLTGRSIYETDRGHLHHCLLRRGYSNRKTLVWVGILCASTAVGALLSVSNQNEWLAIASVTLVGGLLVLTRFFGHVEVRLLGQRLKNQIGSLDPRRNWARHRPMPIATQLQGNGQWKDLWKTLIEFADRFDLCDVQLNINLPAIHEGYHASWKRKESPDRRQFWHTDIPLVTQNQTVGRLQITGRCEEGSVCAWMGELIAGLKPFETLMLALVEEHLSVAGILPESPTAALGKPVADGEFEPLSADVGAVE